MKTFREKCKELNYYKIQNYSLFKDKPYDYYEGFTGVDLLNTSTNYNFEFYQRQEYLLL